MQADIENLATGSTGQTELSRERLGSMVVRVLSQLIAAVEAGESIVITKRGKPVARLSPEQPPRKPVDVGWLQSVTDQMTYSDTHAGDLVRAMRDERY